jgi:hypothetical protein
MRASAEHTLHQSAQVQGKHGGYPDYTKSGSPVHRRLASGADQLSLPENIPP